jgi:sec-independent protein translocase protein TatA
MTALDLILALSAPGPLEMVVILIVAVLLFGKRLPEVARGLGKSLNEFKRGLKEASQVKDEVTGEVRNLADSDPIKEIKQLKDDITS